MSIQDINQVCVIGRLTKDPEYSVSGTYSLCKLSIANNRGKTKNGAELPPNFFDITAWNKLAEICNQYLNKGSQVCISGRLQQDRWQDKQNNNRSKVTIIANDIQFLSKSNNGNNTNNNVMQKKEEFIDMTAMPLGDANGIIDDPF